MKTRSTQLAAALAVACAGAALPLHAGFLKGIEDRAKAPADAQVEIEINGRPAPAALRNAAPQTATHSESQSVTVTSDGRQTIRRTVTTRNGVTEETTEILDGDGAREDQAAPAQNPEQQQNPANSFGARVEEADAALRDQLDLAEDEGLVLVRLEEQGPAAAAGLQCNDILLFANDQPLSDPADLQEILSGLEAGDRLTVDYLRKGQAGVAIVQVGECRQEDQGQAQAGPAGDAEAKPQVEIIMRGNPDLDSMLDDPKIPQAMRDRMREMLRTGHAKMD